MEKNIIYEMQLLVIGGKAFLIILRVMGVFFFLFRG